MSQPWRLARSASDLPPPPAGWRGTLWLDLETRSGDRSRGGTDPWAGDRMCGAALAFDDAPEAVYAPVRHSDPRWNLPLDAVLAWLRDWLSACGRWRNHNVKFDAHFAHADGLPTPEVLVDTLTEAKLLESDRLRGYGLKELAQDWLGRAPDERDEVRAWMEGARTKDFADVPADLLGRYACADVQANRLLGAHLDERMPEQCARVRATEAAVTSVLVRVERRGLATVPELELKRQQAASLRAMILAADRLHELTGLEFTNSNDHFRELLCDRMGLPVLARTETGQPSFDADALSKYAILPEVLVDPERREVIELALRFRGEQTFKSLFVDAFLERRGGDGLLHSSYNQCIRTGRMSCSRPNSQQMSPRAKALIVPGPGEAFLAFDASQVEFRCIVHYIQDAACVEAYRRDPATDYHSWVAEITGMRRHNAKNVNFAVAFGAGKRKIVRMLAADDDVVAAAVAEAQAKGVPASGLAEHVRAATLARGEAAYELYHERLPNLQRTARQAEAVARRRGYVFNAFGRRRHIPSDRARIAFNTLNQSTAGDYVKDRMAAVEPWAERELGLGLVAQVHDELLFRGPAEACADPGVQRRIAEMLEVQAVPFRVPFLWKGGASAVSWAEAKGN